MLGRLSSALFPFPLPYLPLKAVAWFLGGLAGLAYECNFSPPPPPPHTKKKKQKTTQNKKKNKKIFFPLGPR